MRTARDRVSFGRAGSNPAAGASLTIVKKIKSAKKQKPLHLNIPIATKIYMPTHLPQYIQRPKTEWKCNTNYFNPKMIRRIVTINLSGTKINWKKFKR